MNLYNYKPHKSHKPPRFLTRTNRRKNMSNTKNMSKSYIERLEKELREKIDALQNETSLDLTKMFDDTLAYYKGEES